MINIKADTKEFTARLEKFKAELPKSIGKKLMRLVFNKMRNDIRKNIRANFKRRKGWLYQGVNYWAFNDFAGSIFSKNSKQQRVKYASVLENGSVIRPKDGNKYLYIYAGKTDKGGVILKKVKSVTIPSKPFFTPVVNDYWGGGGFKAKKIMEEGLQKEINKIMEKKGNGITEKGDNG
jgi:hypothetical protein